MTSFLCWTLSPDEKKSSPTLHFLWNMRPKRSFNAEKEGSVIKHQLVTHLMLGIALRAVLDTLRKPEDSKMIFFGTKALEQFVDRLIGWPQYRNHILHFVAFIERALNKILASHTEPDVGHSVYTDHRLGLIQSSDPHMEVLSIVSYLPVK
ncbi:uncharacterized protein LOC121787368 isoform X1 [Salvia splendens]|uniref:uncharacterized protein LOC121787368 isoform X1 n=1 Tax=Salvia splendens TaxID=180675 RepID=UPI001C26BCB4|nr:uncharacterized protein LOC121787368 isoform X1 [Salvia splendens]